MYLLIICLIILSILYLLYRNNQYNKILESFDNTQSSLSTMYENSIDSDDYKRNIYEFNNIGNITNLTNNGSNWNGIWKSSEANEIYCNIFQINDKLIVSLSLYYNIYKMREIINNLSTIDDCKPNYFIGVGMLNFDKTDFLINKSNIRCDNFIPYGNNKIISLKGTLLNNNNNKTINLSITLNNQNTLNYTLNFFKPYNTNNNYKSSTLLPYIPESEFYLEEIICHNTNESPCRYTEYGLGETVYGRDLNGNNYNACGIIRHDPLHPTIPNICDPNNTSCVFSANPPNSNGLSQISSCRPIIKNISDYMNFTPMNILTKNINNSMYLCDYLQYLKSCNSCILCYINNISNAYTLNYQFFGTLPGESSLTVQADMMDQMLNTPIYNSDINNISLLSYYRNILNTKINPNLEEITKGVSFINYPQSYTQNEAINMCNNFSKKYNGPIGNNEYVPALWKIYSGSQNNVNNSCTFNLSTSSNYNTPVKYVNCNDNGTVDLSLFRNGNKQDLVLDNYLIIKSAKDQRSNSTVAVAITANIKTFNGLYLVPSMDVSGFSNNSILLKTSNIPSENGKWLILGLTINNINNLTNTLKNLSYNNS